MLVTRPQLKRRDALETLDAVPQHSSDSIPKVTAEEAPLSDSDVQDKQADPVPAASGGSSSHTVPLSRDEAPTQGDPEGLSTARPDTRVPSASTALRAALDNLKLRRAEQASAVAVAAADSAASVATTDLKVNAAEASGQLDLESRRQGDEQSSERPDPAADASAAAADMLDMQRSGQLTGDDVSSTSLDDPSLQASPRDLTGPIDLSQLRLSLPESCDRMNVSDSEAGGSAWGGSGASLYESDDASSGFDDDSIPSSAMRQSNVFREGSALPARALASAENGPSDLFYDPNDDGAPYDLRRMARRLDGGGAQDSVASGSDAGDGLSSVASWGVCSSVDTLGYPRRFEVAATLAAAERRRR